MCGGKSHQKNTIIKEIKKKIMTSKQHVNYSGRTNGVLIYLSLEIKYKAIKGEETIKYVTFIT